MIGGKVLDASALAALVRGYQSMVAWISVAKSTGIVFYVPSLALTEVRAVRPDAGPALAELLGHSVVVLGELDAATANAVDRLLDEAGMFDALAGHVIQVARGRGWPTLSSDPGRLHRIDPDLEITLA